MMGSWDGTIWFIQADADVRPTNIHSCSEAHGGNYNRRPSQPPQIHNGIFSYLFHFFYCGFEGTQRYATLRCLTGGGGTPLTLSSVPAIILLWMVHRQKPVFNRKWGVCIAGFCLAWASSAGCSSSSLASQCWGSAWRFFYMTFTNLS